MSWERQNLEAEYAAAVANRQHSLDDYERTGVYIYTTYALLWEATAMTIKEELEGLNDYSN